MSTTLINPFDEKQFNHITSNDLLAELIRNQLENVSEDKKLYYIDMKRITKNISTSIFHPTMCCIWKGYITNINKKNINLCSLESH